MQIKNKEKRNKIILTIVLILIVLFADIIFYSKFIYNERSYHTESHLEYDNKYELDGNVLIEQSFIANGNNLEAVAIGFDKEFRTYNKKDINIKIVDVEKNTTIAEYNNIYQAPVQDWKKYKFNFDRQENSETKEYKIVINYADGSKDNAVLYNSKKEFNQGKLVINGEEQEANISFELYYHSNYATGVWLVGMILLNIIAITGIILLVNKKLSIEKLFLVIVIPIGLLYIIFMPMYRGHDEHAHFFRAYEISRGVFNTKIENDMSITSIPAAFETITEGTDRYFNEPYYENLIKFLKTETVQGENISENGCYMAVYSPLPYIPQALAIGITDIFTNNVAIIFYAARIVNFLFTVFVLYMAIKIIPFGKKIILLIAIIPTTMTQIASMSPDATTLSSCILFIAYFLKVWESAKQIGKKETALLTLLGSAIALSKIVYIPFILLIALLPKNKFKSKKQRILIKVLTIGLPILLNLIWLKIANTHLTLIDNNKSSVQTAFILTNLPEYIRTIAFTIPYIFGDILNQLFGGSLMHVDWVSNGIIVTLPMIILFVLEILFDEEIKDKISKKTKWVLSIILIMIAGLIATSLYVQWSPLKWFFINGIQGRYFLQFLLPLVLLLGQNKWIKNNGNIKLLSIIKYSAILINFYAIAQILITFI